MTEQVKLEEYSVAQLNNICGNHDENFKMIEEALKVEISLRGDELSLTGKDSESFEEAKRVVFALLKLVSKGINISLLDVIYALKLVKEDNLGFLPGDLKEKVDPYLRPLYDALHDMLGVEQTERLIEKGIIEIAPLAYMRGRTLEDAYVILDEAQNTTDNQMKMFLTRLGFNSKMIITGDVTQIDLPRGVESGLIRAMNILNNVKGISFIHLTAMDVVRHPVVQRIIERYEGKHE